MENVWNIIMVILELLFFIGFPSFFVIAGIILLIRAFVSKTVSTGRKHQKKITEAVVIDKREYSYTYRNGIITVYYLTFEFGLEDKMECRASKKEYKSASVGDKVKICYIGEKLIKIELI